MGKGGYVKALLSATLLLATASCTDVPPPQFVWLPEWAPTPGRLALSNYRFDHAQIEAVVTPAADCATADPAVAVTSFDLPFKGTRVLVATPNSDICWRRRLMGGRWSDWNRAFTASGRYIDTQL